jgi:hypothetical protein
LAVKGSVAIRKPLPSHSGRRNTLTEQITAHVQQGGRTHAHEQAHAGKRSSTPSFAGIENLDVALPMRRPTAPAIAANLTEAPSISSSVEIAMANYATNQPTRADYRSPGASLAHSNKHTQFHIEWSRYNIHR